ncbi:hypothetical protein ABZ951_04785 [Streptomyces sp. NPDC046215]|uniref:Flavin reductase like domain-containing protein n=1 Tax=Streptomyces stramineus TaxID=173861 RepID=A0ABP3KVL8_9ACTN
MTTAPDRTLPAPGGPCALTTVDPDGFRALMASHPGGVAVVTTTDGLGTAAVRPARLCDVAVGLTGHIS